MRARLLLANILVVAACALVYELLVATLASYVLGDAVTQFSLVLGVYLSAMGLGGWLSRAVAAHPARRYVEAEIMLAVVGGGSLPLLLLVSHGPLFRVMLYGDVVAIGALVGLELPLLVRILGADGAFRDVVARALAFDYAGALVASILFPLVLVPSLGLARTALLTGAVNALVALSATAILRSALPGRVTVLRAAASITAAALVFGVVRAGAWTALVGD